MEVVGNRDKGKIKEDSCFYWYQSHSFHSFLKLSFTSFLIIIQLILNHYFMFNLLLLLLKIKLAAIIN